MQQIIVTLIFFLIFSMVAFSQDTSIQITLPRLIGIVVNNFDREPVPNALVKVINKKNGKEVTLTTNNEGNFFAELNLGEKYSIYAKSGELITEKEEIVTIGLIKKVYNIVLKIPVGMVTSASDNVIKPINTDSIEDEKIVFKVEIGTFSEPLKIESEYLSPIRNLLEVETTTDNKIRYVVGKFSEYGKAVQYCQQLSYLGYDHPEVKVYMGNKCLDMSLSEALDLVEKERLLKQK